jgi:hypothetical protein
VTIRSSAPRTEGSGKPSAHGRSASGRPRSMARASRGVIGTSCTRSLESIATAAYALSMCRNIRTLHNFAPPATEDEVHDAALQYVRKISGSTKPSRANEAAFDRAVEAVTAATRQLLADLVTSAPPKDREIEAAKRRARYELSRAGT